VGRPQLPAEGKHPTPETPKKALYKSSKNIPFSKSTQTLAQVGGWKIGETTQHEICSYMFRVYVNLLEGIVLYTP